LTFIPFGASVILPILAGYMAAKALEGGSKEGAIAGVLLIVISG